MAAITEEFIQLFFFFFGGSLSLQKYSRDERRNAVYMHAVTKDALKPRMSQRWTKELLLDAKGGLTIKNR